MDSTFSLFFPLVQQECSEDPAAIVGGGSECTVPSSTINTLRKAPNTQLLPGDATAMLDVYFLYCLDIHNICKTKFPVEELCNKHVFSLVYLCIYS